MAVSSGSKRPYTGLPTLGTNDHEEKTSEWVPSWFLLLLLGFYVLVGFVTTIIEDALPRPINDWDIRKDDANTFSEHSARKYLKKILGNEPRVSGTVGHAFRSEDLKHLVDFIANDAKLPVHTDWQYVDGDYWLDFKSPHVNVYQNLSNIIAVLEGESGFNFDGTTRSSILVNCHYDSVPFAIGASDNGVFCAVMAETLSKLSRRKTKLKHNIIFLFNGAEENVLLGSHGFLSHPWSKGVVSVVNLDAAGMNGKPNVFQVTDPRVLDIYKRTNNRPTAQGMGEFLFSTGIIPSDTDFRIWRDFGNITGIDIAFIKWGHVYHTRNDRPELIQDGVIQNAGNMLLNLVRDMADYQELADKEPPSTVVYFDYLGLFLITYTWSVALLVDAIVGVLGLLSVAYFLWYFGCRWSSVCDLLWSVVSRLTCVVAGVAAVAVCTALMVVTTTQMRYLSENWIVIPFYWLPYFVASIVTSHSFDSWRNKKRSLNRSIRTSQAAAANRLTLSLLLLLLCCSPSLSSVRYIITTPLIVMSVASVIIMTVIRHARIKAWQHLSLEVFLNLPATMNAFSLATRFNSLLIPIMGRSSNDYPDGVIAAANTAIIVLVAFTVSGMEILFSRKRLWLVLSGVSIISIVLMFIPFSPYRGEDVTQRHYWFHSQITSYNANSTPIESVSGVLISKVDVYNVHSALSAIKNSDLYVKDGEVTQDKHKLQIRDSDLKIISEECEQLLYCNMPMLRPRFEKFLYNSVFIEMSPPAPFSHSLQIVERACVHDTCTYSFIMKGPTNNGITIWPRQNVTLTGWSFSSPVNKTLTVQGRPVYVVIQSTATYSEKRKPLEFTLKLHVPQSLQSSVLLDISYYAHQIFHPENFTDDYKQLLEVMPEYFNIATILTFRNNYVF